MYSSLVMFSPFTPSGSAKSNPLVQGKDGNSFEGGTFPSENIVSALIIAKKMKMNPGHCPESFSKQ